MRSQLASKRAGTAKAKERGEIRGTRTKIYKQKGTGRARQGDGKAGHFVGGGVIHGPRPRTFEVKVNKKTRKAALVAALSRRQQEGRLAVIDDMTLAEIKTKRVAGVLSAFEAPKALLCDVANDNLQRSARNLATAHYVGVGQLNVYDILRHDNLLLSKAAVEALTERMG